MTLMGGSIGGDFGLSLGHLVNADQKVSVLREGARYSITLTPNSGVEVELWFATNSEFRVEGFMWVSEDGTLPQLTRAENNDELVSTLVRYLAYT